ncbi:hypothetical protein D3C80_950770 [compost metagenome]
MAQVVKQVGHAPHQALPACVQQLFDRKRVEQRVARCQGVIDHAEQKMCAGAVIVVQVAFVDPLARLLLPGQIGLQAPAIKRVLAPGRVAEAAIARVGLVGRVAQHHAAQLAAERQQVPRSVQRVGQAVAANPAQGRHQVAPTQAEYGVLHIHAGGGERFRSFGRFVCHGNTPSSSRFLGSDNQPPEAGRGCMTAR